MLKNKRRHLFIIIKICLFGHKVENNYTNIIVNMGKRIRHLEFYGYIDQNAYIGLPNVDLSDIREVNREQDKEIQELSGTTKDKADLSVVLELSGKVDTFIGTQSTINDGLADAISNNTSRIEALERRDEEITEKINELVDDLNPIEDKINELSDKIDGMDEKLQQHINQEHTFEAEITERLADVEQQVSNKLDKTEAELLYAKKDDVYTKAETDALIDSAMEDYATKEWVQSRGYITEIDADTKYASKQALNATNDRLNEVQTTLYRQYNELSSEVTSFKADTNVRIETLYGRVDTLDAKHDREIANINNTIASVERDVQRNKDDITTINTISLPNKVDKVDFNDLKNDVNSIRGLLDGKVDKTTYDHDIDIINSKLENIGDIYATKRELNYVSGAVGTLDSRVTTEVENSVNRDNVLDEKIAAIKTNIEEIRESDVARDERIGALSNALAEEIENRAQGDLRLLGSTSDVESDLTIYGAKKYADKVAAQTLNAAKDYSDAKDTELRNYVNDEVKAPLLQEISGKADKEYINSVKRELEVTIDDKVEVEKQRAMNEESVIKGRISSETDRAITQENKLISGLTHTSNIVAALTDWEGDDRKDYTDEGNGIVDVMHREIHDMKAAIANVSEGNETKNDHEAAFGTYNKSNTGYDPAEMTVFSIGIGSSELDRKNAFEVRKNGDIYMWVNGEFKCVNELLSNL